MDRSAVAKKTNRKHRNSGQKREKPARRTSTAGRKAASALPRPANDTDHLPIAPDVGPDAELTDAVMAHDVPDEAALAAAAGFEGVEDVDVTVVTAVEDVHAVEELVADAAEDEE